MSSVPTSSAPTGATPGRTQRERVLRLLVQRGARGITQADLYDPADGGAPIARLASRISDLRALGHDIRARRQTNGVARYALTAAPATVRDTPPDQPDPHEPQPVLVDVEPIAPRSPFDPWSDAA